MSKPKLELTWIGKEIRPQLEPRILIEDATLSYHASARVTNDDLFDNRLIFGDNLLVLKALEQEFTGKVNCVYIDPPFNTQQAFEHYDDGVEHSLWLTLMRDRLEILQRLLAPSGSIFIHIDDTELGYLIALADEVFGRGNRISVITFKQSSASGPKSVNPGLVTTANFILYYAKDRKLWKPFKVFVPTSRDSRYGKFVENVEDPVEQWRLIALREAFCREYQAAWHTLKAKFADALETKMAEFVLANAERVVRTARVSPADVNEDAREALRKSIASPGIVFQSTRETKDPYRFLDGEQLLFYRSKARIINGRLTTAAAATNIWDDILSNNLHNEGGVSFPNGKKPELLLKRIIDLSTERGDLVLDSFAGSGTTGAVAHKMGRRWILAEHGGHCQTHILPRMMRVVAGNDPSGATEAVDWRGGGGFRYFRLGPSLLEKDRWGNWVVSKQYNAPMLAEALCKLEGFAYAPSDSVYWQHGRSTERDFIYVTTQKLTHAQLAALSEDVGEDRSLLVYCMAFRTKPASFQNLTIKKIPMAVLHRCEWGKDDYSLQVASLPATRPPNGAEGAGTEVTGSRRKSTAPQATASLFDGEDKE